MRIAKMEDLVGFTIVGAKDFEDVGTSLEMIILQREDELHIVTFNRFREGVSLDVDNKHIATIGKE